MKSFIVSLVIICACFIDSEEGYASTYCRTAPNGVVICNDNQSGRSWVVYTSPNGNSTITPTYIPPQQSVPPQNFSECVTALGCIPGSR